MYGIKSIYHTYGRFFLLLLPRFQLQSSHPHANHYTMIKGLSPLGCLGGFHWTIYSYFPIGTEATSIRPELGRKSGFPSLPFLSTSKCTSSKRGLATGIIPLFFNPNLLYYGGGFLSHIRSGSQVLDRLGQYFCRGGSILVSKLLYFTVPVRLLMSPQNISLLNL